LIRPRVLVADDHAALLNATTALLKPQYDVVGTATDGATLVSEALRFCPDVIVADITMPVLSGMDAAHQLRESALSAKIVFLTIHSEGQFVKNSQSTILKITVANTFRCLAVFARQRAVRT
jgi:DNA-binding NarL/FixJ family response regulator